MEKAPLADCRWAGGFGSEILRAPIPGRKVGDLRPRLFTQPRPEAAMPRLLTINGTTAIIELCAEVGDGMKG